MERSKKRWWLVLGSEFEERQPQQQEGCRGWRDETNHGGCGFGQPRLRNGNGDGQKVCSLETGVTMSACPIEATEEVAKVSYRQTRDNRKRGAGRRTR